MAPDDSPRSGGSQHESDDRTGTPSDGVRSLGVDVVQRLAEATGEAPVALPPLHETVDVDALDSVLRADSDGGREPPTLVFSHAGRRVRVTAGGDVAVSDGDGTTADDAWTHVSAVDEDGDGDVATRLTLALAERTDRDPAQVRAALADAVDLDALSRLNRPRANGVSRSGASVRFSVLGRDVVVEPDGTIAAGSSLSRLKRTGGNVLVVGTVPDALVDAASAGLLGERGPGRERRHLFTLLDRDLDVVSDRLPAVDASSAHVVNYATAPRSVAVAHASSDGGPDPTPTVTDVTGGFDAVGEAIATALSDLAADVPGETPGELRLCLDSLRPVLEERDDVGAFLEPICESVRSAAALAHYVLPIDRTSPSVRSIEPLFDATVELRVNETEPEQRWHLHGSDYTTDWFALRDRQ